MYKWNILYAAYHRESLDDLYLIRNRVLHTLVGCWLQTDKMGYADGANLYQYVGSSAVMYVDPEGNIRWGAILRLAAGAIVTVAAIASAPVTGGGSLVAAGAVLTGTFSMVSGAAELVADAAGHPDQANLVPSSYADAVVGTTMRAIGADPNLTQAVAGTIDLLTPSTPNLDKVSGIYKVAINANDLNTIYGTASGGANYLGSMIVGNQSTSTVPAQHFPAQTIAPPANPAPAIDAEAKGRKVRVDFDLKCPDKFAGHIIRNGDSLWRLWKDAGGDKSGVTWTEMKNANSFLKDANKLKIGWGVCKPKC